MGIDFVVGSPLHPRTAAAMLATLARSPAGLAATSLFFDAASAVVLALAVWYGMQRAMPPRALPEVNRATCDCSCWDTRFKAEHGHTGYKTLYFSFDERLPYLVSWTALCAALAASAIRAISRGLAKRPLLDWLDPWLAVALLQVYPAHYSWWCIFNYLNEGSTRMLYTQLFFAVSDGVVACTAAYALRHGSVAPFAAWAASASSFSHVLANLSLLGSNASPRLGLVLMWWSDCLTLALLAVVLYRKICGLGSRPAKGGAEDSCTPHYSQAAATRDGVAAAAAAIAAVLFIRSACFWDPERC
jgi:hypothetical protein